VFLEKRIDLCNRNPYAPQVPCHRVVGSDGSLTGFASGIDKKRQILKKEGIRVSSLFMSLKSNVIRFVDTIYREEGSKLAVSFT